MTQCMCYTRTICSRAGVDIQRYNTLVVIILSHKRFQSTTCRNQHAIVTVGEESNTHPSPPHEAVTCLETLITTPIPLLIPTNSGEWRYIRPPTLNQV